MCRLNVWIVLGLLLVAGLARADERWQRIVELRGQWKFSIGDNKKWADIAYNDSEWETIYVPRSWEDQGFNGFNGFAWYRRQFDGTLLKDQDTPYHLFMGYIDDADEVYLNGRLIGSSGSFPPRYHTAFNALRRYNIPKEYINFKGKNVIAVRVYDAEIEGGIVSGDVGIYVNENERPLLLSLNGIWDFALEERKTKHSAPKDYNTRRTPPENLHWAKLMVPGLWEHQGYPNFDGSAWYKKQFFVPKSMEGVDVVLILGKIDDYDQTYLNGKLIGSTNKHDHLRVYFIPSDALQAGAWNILLIYVDDPQGYGGLYEGPFGFMKQSEFTRFMRWKN
jgi:beta-galactosidase/beta-glucuronidase